jgi:hypothetical protein
MKTITLFATLLASSFAMAAQTRWNLFPSTKSPNGKLIIAWKGTDESATNALIKVQDKTVVATLTRMENWDIEQVAVLAKTREADGLNGIQTLWSKDSSLVAVLDQSKRGTNALELVSATGKKYALYKKIEEDTATFLKKKHGSKFSKAREGMNFVCTAKQISSTKFTVSVNAWSKMTTFTDDVKLTYTLRVTAAGIQVTGSIASQEKASS